MKVPLYYYFRRPGSLSNQLKGHSSYTLARIFEEYAQKTDKPMARKLYLIDAIKRGLIGRYLMSLYHEEKVYFRECNEMLMRVLKQAWRMSNISIKEKLLYTVMVAFRQVYRLFRIIDDPTLLTLKRSVRKERKRSDKKQAG